MLYNDFNAKKVKECGGDLVSLFKLLPNIQKSDLVLLQDVKTNVFVFKKHSDIEIVLKHKLCNRSIHFVNMIIEVILKENIFEKIKQNSEQKYWALVCFVTKILCDKAQDLKNSEDPQEKVALVKIQQVLQKIMDSNVSLKCLKNSNFFFTDFDKNTLLNNIRQKEIILDNNLHLRLFKENIELCTENNENKLFKIF